MFNPFNFYASLMNSTFDMWGKFAINQYCAQLRAMKKLS